MHTAALGQIILQYAFQRRGNTKAAKLLRLPERSFRRLSMGKERASLAKLLLKGSGYDQDGHCDMILLPVADVHVALAPRRPPSSVRYWGRQA